MYLPIILIQPTTKVQIWTATGILNLFVFVCSSLRQVSVNSLRDTMTSTDTGDKQDAAIMPDVISTHVP